MTARFDLIVVGGGPAGLAAAICGARSRLSTLLIEKGQPGGRAAHIMQIDNFPGAGCTTGPDLVSRFRGQAEALGVTFLQAEVSRLEPEGPFKTVYTRQGVAYEARAVILCPGAEPRTLGVRGEERLRGRGVHYAVADSAADWAGRDVVVVGDGDAAVAAAVHLAQSARKVSLVCIHSEDRMDACPASLAQLRGSSGIQVIAQTAVEEIQGEGRVERVVLRSLVNGERWTLPADAVFVLAGITPCTDFLRGSGIHLDARGYIIADPETMATSVDGIYAAGDARRKWVRQVITAAADGAIAARSAERFLADEELVNHELLGPADPVLAVFWSPADPLSLDVLQQVEQVAGSAGGRVHVVRIDCQQSARVAQRLGVVEVPTVMLFHRGIPLATLTEDFNHLADWVAGHMPARI